MEGVVSRPVLRRRQRLGAERRGGAAGGDVVRAAGRAVGAEAGGRETRGGNGGATDGLRCGSSCSTTSNPRAVCGHSANAGSSNSWGCSPRACLSTRSGGGSNSSGVGLGGDAEERSGLLRGLARLQLLLVAVRVERRGELQRAVRGDEALRQKLGEHAAIGGGCELHDKLICVLVEAVDDDGNDAVHHLHVDPLAAAARCVLGARGLEAEEAHRNGLQRGHEVAPKARGGEEFLNAEAEGRLRAEDRLNGELPRQRVVGAAGERLQSA